LDHLEKESNTTHEEYLVDRVFDAKSQKKDILTKALNLVRTKSEKVKKL